MPPKKGNSKPKKELEAAPSQAGSLDQGELKSSSAQKRKRPSQENGSPKTARRSGRGSAKSKPSQQQLLNYLLSEHATDLCRPNEESEFLESQKGAQTYSGSILNPFEELLCAVVLSRPISHMLGLRTIRTVLNEPYNFTSAKAVKDAGEQKIHEAIWEARTQHKQKTADEILHVANVVLDNYTSDGDTKGESLQAALDQNDGDVEKTVEALQNNIKGFAKTGSSIFMRRVQWLWTAGYPYVDDRTAAALQKLDLPAEASTLQKAIDQEWSKLDTQHVDGKDDAAKRMRAFVIILERAIGADLENKIDDLVVAARETK